MGVWVVEEKNHQKRQKKGYLYARRTDDDTGTCLNSTTSFPIEALLHAKQKNRKQALIVK